MEEFALLFYKVYIYTYMLILTVNKKSGHEFEKEQKEVYGSDRR